MEVNTEMCFIVVHAESPSNEAVFGNPKAYLKAYTTAGEKWAYLLQIGIVQLQWFFSIR